MKKVKITYEAIVEDEQVKSEDDVLLEGFDNLADAVSSDGLDGIIDGSYEWSVNFEVLDMD